MQRVFIGIPPNPSCQLAIDRLLKPFQRQRPAVRWVPHGNRHLTLAFLGATPPAMVTQLDTALAGAFGPFRTFRFDWTCLRRFPGQRGNIIALTGDLDRQLATVFERTHELLRSKNISIDERQIRPHMTLARTRRTGAVDMTLPQALDIPMLIDRIRLYQSTLTASGPVYEVLKEARLKTDSD